MASVTVKLTGLEGVMKTLQSLPAEIVSKGGGPVRRALRKASVVMQKEVKQNLQTIIAEPNADGEVSESTGLLDKNIVITRGKGRQKIKGERYTVRVRNKPYTNKKGKRVTTAQNARLLEYGTERRKAYPFIRPAFEAKKGEVLSTFVTEVNKDISRIVKKLERQNRVA